MRGVSRGERHAANGTGMGLKEEHAVVAPITVLHGETQEEKKIVEL